MSDTHLSCVNELLRVRLGIGGGASSTRIALPADLLHWVLDESNNFERVKKAIKAKAAQKVKEDQAWLALTAENWEKWGDKFTGK